MTGPAWAPQVQDVADWLPRRTTDGSGLAAGTFTDETVPNAGQVSRIITSVVGQVAAALPDLPPALYAPATRLAALGAAAQIELSFYPESQVDVARPLWDQFAAMLRWLQEAVTSLTGALEPGEAAGGVAGGDGVIAMPRGLFPPVPGRLTRDDLAPYYVPTPVYRY